MTSEDEEIVASEVGVRWWRQVPPALQWTAVAAPVVVGVVAGARPAFVTLSVVVSAALLWSGREARERSMTLRVTREGLRVTDARSERVVTTAETQQATVRARGLDATLVIELKGRRRVELRLPRPRSAALAASCIELLGLGPDRRVTEFRNPVRVARMVTSWLIGVAVGVISWAVLFAERFREVEGFPHDVAICAWLLLCALVTGQATRTIDLVVGADGVELRGPWRRRFIPYASLEDLGWERQTRTLTLREPGRQHWSYTTRVTGTSIIEVDEAANAFLDAVSRARALYERRRHETELANLLKKGARSMQAWRESLRQFAEGGAAYRAQALGLAEVAQMLDDASADAEVRLGAAMALRASRPTEEPTRIRVAAEACANPAMRAALERVADDTLDEDALAAAKRG